MLTPHHKGYYEGRNSPHTAESPEPASFLVLAPGTRFTLYVSWDPPRGIPDQYANSWRQLVQALFEYIFENGGFGAKTSVGYGVLRPVNNQATAP